MEPLLVARDLHKTFRRPQGNLPVLTGCDLTLDEAEAVAIIGASGAGKSTLLNLLGGLDAPDRPAGGSVAHQGRRLDFDDLGALTAWRQQIVGFIFQFHFLLPDFTALENLLIPARIRRRPQAVDQARAARLLDVLELTDRRDHLPGELSGGEQQRVAVARAFMNHPQIVLADEPFGNLDRERGERLGQLLFELRREEGIGMVIVTHDLALAKRADRVLRLTGGRLVPATAEVTA